MAAVRVAELDATRLLTERVYGFQLEAGTAVYDLGLGSDRLASELHSRIQGVATTEDPVYKDDGTVEIVRAVKMRQIIETLTENIKQWESEHKLTIKARSTVGYEDQDTVIKVLGNGALPGSLGLLKIQAKSAAEMDAYRRLAERIMGLHLTSHTTVRDFVLESDLILPTFASLTAAFVVWWVGPRARLDNPLVRRPSLGLAHALFVSESAIATD